MTTNLKSRSHFTRRVRNLLLTVCATAALLLVVSWQNQNLIRNNFASGYILLGSIVFLAAFNLRKKIAVLPGIGSAAFWMQLHIYIGLLTFAIFGIHIAGRLPTGLFEIFLAAVYLAVACSGVYGLYATRVLPKRLTAISDEVIFEQIPWLRRQIADQAQSAVLEVCHSSDVLARFYANRLAGYLERPRGLGYLLVPTGNRRRQMIAEIGELDRFLSVQQRPTGCKLAQWVQRKDDLDYHQAIQGRLKIWLFVHIGLTYSLLAAGVLHGILVHAFHGGLP